VAMVSHGESQRERLHVTWNGEEDLMEEIEKETDEGHFKRTEGAGRRQIVKGGIGPQLLFPKRR